MKKIITILLTLCMILSLAACSNSSNSAQQPAASTKPAAETPEAPVGAGVASPITEYASLDEINDIVGCRLSTPGVAGSQDLCYLIIDAGDYKIAEYQYEVNGNKFSERCSATAGPDTDISGVWGENGTVFENSDGSNDIEYAESADCKCARWFTIDGQYVMTLKEGTMDMDTFKMVCEEAKAASNPNQMDTAGMYAVMEGTYMDSYSMRAAAKVSNLDDHVEIVISWANSAFEYQTWTMNARFSEDGLLSYKDELLELVTYNNDGVEEKRETLEENREGYFEYTEDGKLLWTGAADENCKNCVFELMESAE